MEDNGTKSRMLLLGLMLLVFASLTAGGVVEWETLELTPAQRILAMVPASARANFLLYQLALAINSGNILEQQLELDQEQEWLEEETLDSSWLAAMANEFQHIPVYESFPTDLENWLMDSYGLSATDVYHSWGYQAARSSSSGSGKRQQMCTSDGQCYDMAQIGAVCCPF